MAASGSRKQTQDSRGGGRGGTTCSLPNGIRTGPVTNDVVSQSRDQPNQRAHSTNAGTVTTTHGLPTRIARNARAGPVPSTCEAAQPPRPLTSVWIWQCRQSLEEPSSQTEHRQSHDFLAGLIVAYNDTFANVHAYCWLRFSKGKIEDIGVFVVVPGDGRRFSQNSYRFHSAAVPSLPNRDFSLLPGDLLLAHRPVLLRHRGLDTGARIVAGLSCSLKYKKKLDTTDSPL